MSPKDPPADPGAARFLAPVPSVAGRRPAREPARRGMGRYRRSARRRDPGGGGVLRHLHTFLGCCRGGAPAPAAVASRPVPVRRVDDLVKYVPSGVVLYNARGVHDASTAELGRIARPRVAPRHPRLRPRQGRRGAAERLPRGSRPTAPSCSWAKAPSPPPSRTGSAPSSARSCEWHGPPAPLRAGSSTRSSICPSSCPVPQPGAAPPGRGAAGNIALPRKP